MLEVRNLSVTYGFHRALEAVDLSVEKGEICVILGANGAGKSSLLNAIAGMVRADEGSEIVMNSTPITRLKAHRIVEAGIALVPEGRGIFGDLSVAENLQLGAFAARARGEEAAMRRRIYELFPRLAERKRQIARTMSGGEQQMVAIGRALMSKPDILMLDEPSLGLSPILSSELFRSLSEVAKTGVGILLVEQNAKQSLKIAGRGYLVENGHVVGEGTAEALASDPAVVSAYLGGGARGPAKPAITLPPPFRLPAGLAAIGRSAGALGARAGDIQRAFVRAMRRGNALPSAFVGRHDPKAGTDPWEEIAMTPPPPPLPPRTPAVATGARNIAASTGEMAQRAAERLSAHVKTARLSAPEPSAFAQARRHEARPAPATTPSPARPRATGPQTPADLARKAAERMSAYVARKRETAAVPTAFAQAKFQREISDFLPKNHEPASLHGQIGHNSAAFGLEGDSEPDPVPKSNAELSIADIVARAAAIHAAHVARQRKSLSAFASAQERQHLAAYKIAAGPAGTPDTKDNPALAGRANDKET